MEEKEGRMQTVGWPLWINDTERTVRNEAAQFFQLIPAMVSCGKGWTLLLRCSNDFGMRQGVGEHGE